MAERSYLPQPRTRRRSGEDKGIARPLPTPTEVLSVFDSRGRYCTQFDTVHVPYSYSDTQFIPLSVAHKFTSAKMTVGYHQNSSGYTEVDADCRKNAQTAAEQPTGVDFNRFRLYPSGSGYQLQLVTHLDQLKCHQALPNSGEDPTTGCPIYHELDPIVVAGEPTLTLTSAPAESRDCKSPQSSPPHTYQCIAEVHQEVELLRQHQTNAAPGAPEMPMSSMHDRQPQSGNVEAVDDQHGGQSSAAVSSGTKWTLFSRLRLPRRSSSSPRKNSSESGSEAPVAGAAVTRSVTDSEVSPTVSTNRLQNQMATRELPTPGEQTADRKTLTKGHVDSGAAAATPRPTNIRELGLTIAVSSFGWQEDFVSPVVHTSTTTLRRATSGEVLKTTAIKSPPMASFPFPVASSNSNHASSPCCGIKMAEMRAANRRTSITSPVASTSTAVSPAGRLVDPCFGDVVFLDSPPIGSNRIASDGVVSSGWTVVGQIAGRSVSRTLQPRDHQHQQFYANELQQHDTLAAAVACLHTIREEDNPSLTRNRVRYGGATSPLSFRPADVKRRHARSAESRVRSSSGGVAEFSDPPRQRPSSEGRRRETSNVDYVEVDQYPVAQLDDCGVIGLSPFGEDSVSAESGLVQVNHGSAVRIGRPVVSSASKAIRASVAESRSLDRAVASSTSTKQTTSGYSARNGRSPGSKLQQPRSRQSYKKQLTAHEISIFETSTSDGLSTTTNTPASSSLSSASDRSITSSLDSRTAAVVTEEQNCDAQSGSVDESRSNVNVSCSNSLPLVSSPKPGIRVSVASTKKTSRLQSPKELENCRKSMPKDVVSRHSESITSGSSPGQGRNFSPNRTAPVTPVRRKMYSASKPPNKMKPMEDLVGELPSPPEMSSSMTSSSGSSVPGGGAGSTSGADVESVTSQADVMAIDSDDVRWKNRTDGSAADAMTSSSSSFDDCHQPETICKSEVDIDHQCVTSKSSSPCAVISPTHGNYCNSRLAPPKTSVRIAALMSSFPVSVTSASPGRIQTASLVSNGAVSGSPKRRLEFGAGNRGNRQ